MRRRFLFALALVPLAAVAGTHGCSSEAPLDSLCAWIADPGNCYREFRRDMLSGVNPKLDCTFDVGAGAIPTEVNSDPAMPAGYSNGAFPLRAMLDVCIIGSGGQVVFDPPIDLTKIPPSPLDLPTTYTIKLIKGDGTECGKLGYTSPHGFSITIDAPPDAGATSDGGVTLPAPLVDGGVLEFSGSYTQVIAPGRDVFDVTCPSGESHHFNLDEVNGPLAADGGGQASPCAVFAQIVPNARLLIYPGGINTLGSVSFAVDYPPVTGTFPDKSDILNPKKTTPVKPDTIVYFNCSVPAAPETCNNLIKDVAETDVDCGGPQLLAPNPTCLKGNCPRRCDPGQLCLCDGDCSTLANSRCVVDGKTGMRKCEDPMTAVSGSTSVGACTYPPATGTGTCP
jgi:hypothetical protein